MALGQLCPIRAMDQRDMAINRVRPAALDSVHRAHDHQLAKGVVDMIIAADHMGHTHVMIIDHDGQHIGRRAIGTQEDEIIKLGVLDGDLALHDVGDGGRARLRRLDAHDIGGVSGPCIRPGIAPFGNDTERALFSLRCGAARGQLVLGQVAAIGMARFKQLMRDGGVSFRAGKLEHRRLVAIKAQPRQSIENRVNGRFGRTLTVGILNPQQITAAMMAREKPVEQRGARAANMQIARGRGRKTGNNGPPVRCLSACHANACHSSVLPVQ